MQKIRETYLKRLITSYKNLSEEEKKVFRFELNLFEDNPENAYTDEE